MVTTQGDSVKQEEIMLKALRDESTKYKDMLKIVTQIAKMKSVMNRYEVQGGTSPRLVARGTASHAYSPSDGLAEGYVPTFAEGRIGGAFSEERRSISQGVGAARPSAKAVAIKNFPFGGGKRGTVVANTDEHIVPNYQGGKGSAIFNRDMGGSMGLPRGARKITAAGGFIPNFAGEGDFKRGFKTYFRADPNESSMAPSMERFGEQFFRGQSRFG